MSSTGKWQEPVAVLQIATATDAFVVDLQQLHEGHRHRQDRGAEVEQAQEEVNRWCRLLLPSEKEKNSGQLPLLEVRRWPPALARCSECSECC